MSGWRLRDENDTEHYYNATVRLMAEVAELRDENKRLRAEVETWKQRAETAWAKGDEEAETRIRLVAENKRLQGLLDRCVRARPPTRRLVWRCSATILYGDSEPPTLAADDQ